MTENSGFKSGFISIVGSPNVGKSTLMNTFVGQKVAIVSSRPQTTRNRIMGVMTRPDCQIVFLDTPGIHTPKNKLGQYMVKVAYDALNEVDGILFMTDATMGIRQRDEGILAQLKKAKAPVVAAVNKIDAAGKDKVAAMLDRLRMESWLNAAMPISAATGEGLFELEEKLRSFLVPGPKYFPDDMVTDQPERVLCAEMVREKALILLKEEVPHGLGVDIEKMHTRENGLVDIYATIYCERESHKAIVIGKRGAMLKEIGQRARAEMEWMLGAKVNLQLWVKVKEDWRNQPAALRMLGYQDEN